MAAHLPWLKELAGRYEFQNGDDEKAREILQAEVGNVFLQVLEDAGVFKNDEKGNRRFDQWMDCAGFGKLGFSKLSK